jgi:signal transduction histidine kinase
MKNSVFFAVTAQAISLIVLLILAIQFFEQVNSLNQYSAKVEHTYLVINQLSTVRSAIKDAEAASRGFLLTGQDDFQIQLSAAVGKIMPANDSLRRLVSDNLDQLALSKKNENISYRKATFMIESTRLKTRISNDSLNHRLVRGKLAMDKIDSLLDSMRSKEFVLQSERREIKTRYEKTLPRYMRSVFLTAGLLTVVFGFWIFVELRKRFRYQGLLQIKLNELRQSNEELEQIAFAASHDLQEPLRKIRIFSDRLLLKATNAWSDEQKMMLQRMNFSAARLQELISDLVVFNQLVQNKYKTTTVYIKEKLEEHIASLQAKHTDVNFHWNNTDSFPVINGSVEQMDILFQQLFNNSLQFKSPERSLSVTVNCKQVSWASIRGISSEVNQGNFYQLSIRDNGIGFDEAFKDKMFKPFQRLHNVESESSNRRKGMGLAICKRVMINIGGWIDAEGKVGEGAVIYLYFPVTT